MKFTEKQKNVRNVIYQKFRSIHKGMMARCYRENTNNYEYYGGNGVVVCDKWRNLDGFIDDVDKIDGFDLIKILMGELFLDKDKKNKNGNLIYSLENCMWLSQSENTLINKKSQKDMVLISPYPKFEKTIWNNRKLVAKEVGCSDWSLVDLLNGKTKKINGYQLFYLKDFKENLIDKQRPRKFLGISPQGKEYVFYYQLRFAKEHNLTAHTISECIKGKHKQHKGWKFREILEDEEYNKYY